jgi:hypothetical protein
MNRTAHVKSVKALRLFHRDLVVFAQQVSDILGALTLELHRGVDWIEHDRGRYWPQQARAASDALSEARNRLQTCLLQPHPDGQPPCTEEKQAFAVAKQRLRYSEEKLRAVRQCLITSRREADQFRVALSRLAQMIETEIPRALASLDRMSVALERYTRAEVRFRGEQSDDGPAHRIAAEDASIPEADTPGRSSKDKGAHE